MQAKKKIKIGDYAEYSRIISEKDVLEFAEITGDYNPIHMDKLYAKSTSFHAPIVHGILTAGLISTIIGNHLPGPGTIYLKQQLNFHLPVYVGDMITARVEIISINHGKERVILRTICRNQNEDVVLDGKALVKLSNPS
jgi:3-hydroxybutyryl-CoA dehydratase